MYTDLIFIILFAELCENGCNLFARDENANDWYLLVNILMNLWLFMMLASHADGQSRRVFWTLN